ncbi:MAG: flexitail domain-containing putative surface protein [Dehalococcoidia bacterium]
MVKLGSVLLMMLGLLLARGIVSNGIAQEAKESAGHAVPAAAPGGPLPAGLIEGQGEVFPCGPAVPAAIPDNNAAGVTSQCVLTDSRTIVDLNVYLYATHPWVGDLKVTLTHVDTGTSVLIIDRPGVPVSTFGCSADNVDVMLNDEGAPFVETFCGPGAPAIRGNLIPNNTLSDFDGQSLGGTWRLTISDNAAGDTGTLDGWFLLDPDDDADGCIATAEAGLNPLLGGLRDPNNFWDFFDTPDGSNVRDAAITAGDLARVVARFGSSGDKAGDPLSMPPPPTAYHTAFDRTSPGQTPNGVEQGPNGSVTAQDIAVIVSQFGHTCA